MNKKELINKICHDTMIHKRQVSDVLDCVMDTISYEVSEGREVKLNDFGKFYNFRTKAKIGRNVIKNTSMIIEPYNQVKFKAFDKLKQQINK